MDPTEKAYRVGFNAGMEAAARICDEFVKGAEGATPEDIERIGGVRGVVQYISQAIKNVAHDISADATKEPPERKR